MSKLALFGGKPVRTVPFQSSVVIDDEERTLVNEVLDRKEFSRFMGSASEGIEEMLVMPSIEAEKFKSQYFTFLGGRMVRTFEKDYALFTGSDYAISVNSATSGLGTALAAVGCGPGDEVITTCLSFNATALSILTFNSVPVFVDVSPENFCLDHELIRKAVTERTKAILVVHLLGFPADMEAILAIAREYGLAVIEDCAQAPGVLCNGKHVGTLGDLGVFSFQETKNMMTGEGGMIVTNSPNLAKACRLIRNHGESIPDGSWPQESLVNLVGFNFRMTELTAALGVAQLRKLQRNNEIRKQNASELHARLQGLEGLTVVPFPKGSVPHVVPFLYDEQSVGVSRDDILRALRAEGIPVGGGYPRLMPDNPMFQKKIAYGSKGCPWSCHLYTGKITYEQGAFPVARELIASRFIWFYHVHPPNTASDMVQAAEAFRKVFNNLDELRTGVFEKNKLAYKW